MTHLSTVAELSTRLREENISVSLHLFPEYEGINAKWNLSMERKNTAGYVKISLQGEQLEELLERGLETITGVTLRGAPQLTGPKADAPVVQTEHNDPL